MKRTSLIFSSLLAFSLPGIAQSQTETFFNITSADNQSQGMAMVPADLIEGVTVAKPPEVAAYMVKPGVRAFGF
jgi:hypothetical protein